MYWLKKLQNKNTISRWSQKHSKICQTSRLYLFWNCRITSKHFFLKYLVFKINLKTSFIGYTIRRNDIQAGRIHPVLYNSALPESAFIPDAFILNYFGNVAELQKDFIGLLPTFYTLQPNFYTSLRTCPKLKEVKRILEYPKQTLLLIWTIYFASSQINHKEMNYVSIIIKKN